MNRYLIVCATEERPKLLHTVRACCVAVREPADGVMLVSTPLSAEELLVVLRAAGIASNDHGLVVEPIDE
jgi:hypothetical protein